jgi:hypothetical protein
VDAAPAGFVKTTIPLNAPPAGLAFDAAGVLYALEGADSGFNEATLRTIMPNGDFGPSFPVVGEVSANFFVGSMAYDALGNRLLITDNTSSGQPVDGRLYAVDATGVQTTLIRGIANVAGVAARDTGQIFVSTAPFGSSGAVYQIDGSTASPVAGLSDLGFGAGLAFDANGNLIVQDANTTTFRGRLKKVPITMSGGDLTFGVPVPLLENMQSSAGVVVAGNEYFTTGSGGLYRAAGTPLAESVFDSVDPFQWATAITFDPGSQPFEPFAGPDSGRLAYTANFGDLFITVLTPAEPGDYNADGEVDTLDYGVWRTAYGSDSPVADGNRDGVVDSADYLLWRKHSAPGSASTTAGMSVPEPAASALIITSFLTRLCRRRRPLRHQHFVGTTPPARTR